MSYRRKHNRIKHNKKRFKNPTRTFEEIMRQIFPNLKEVQILPLTTKHANIDLSTEPCEDIEGFWQLYRTFFPDWY